MPDFFSRTDLDEARRLGRVSGARLTEQVANCPFQHARMPLRSEWIAGFSEGRISIGPAGSPQGPAAK